MGDIYSITRKMWTGWLILIWLGATGCAGEEIPIIIPQKPASSIVFGNAVVTRGTLIPSGSLPEGSHLGVFAHHIHKNNVVNPAFIKHLKITRSKSVYNYSPAYHWPDSGEVKFHAYYPYHPKAHQPSFDSLRVQADMAKLEIAYITDTLVSNQVDLMFASTKALAGGNVEFHLSHALTALDFEVKKDSMYELKTVSLSALTLKNVKRQGVLTVSTDTVWTTQGPGVNIDVPLSASSLNITSLYQKVTGSNCPILIPQETKGMKVSLEVTIDGAKKRFDIDLSGTDRWKMNDRLSYKLIISDQLSLVTNN
ncbi:MAG: fimbrillin family protein [Tannerellaceae bacterium]|jgi:hypothetical protein|nr:fimbrillin family protein [Tannerellaceae bacterium]